MVSRSFKWSKNECLQAGRNVKDWQGEFVTSATLEAVFIFLYRLQVKYENRWVETLVSQATEKKDCISPSKFLVFHFFLRASYWENLRNLSGSGHGICKRAIFADKEMSISEQV